MAILMGRAHHTKPSQSTAPAPKGMGLKRSSTDSMFTKAFKNTISKPMPVAEPVAGTRKLAMPAQLRGNMGVSFAPETAEPKPRNGPVGAPGPDDNTRRNSGWDRYWSGGSALNLLGFGSGNTAGVSGGNQASNGATVETAPGAYDDGAHRVTQESARVAPLNVYGEPRASYSRVNSASPTISKFNQAHLQQGMSGQIERSASIASSHSAYSSGVPASAAPEAWDSTVPPYAGLGAAGDWEAQRARAASSAYSASVYTSQVNTRPPTEFMPPMYPSGLSKQPQLDAATLQGDMSWINLGAGATK